MTDRRSTGLVGGQRVAFVSAPCVFSGRAPRPDRDLALVHWLVYVAGHARVWRLRDLDDRRRRSAARIHLGHSHLLHVVWCHLVFHVLLPGLDGHAWL